MSLVVDTDVVSFIFKNDTRASLYTSHLSGHILTISFQTLAELELWALAAGWGTRQRQQLTRYLRRYVVNYPLAVTCRRWAEVIDECRRQGRPIAAADAWIAATALLLDVPLVTNNARDYAGVSGLTIIAMSNKP
jgi:tRNA(fMet)-specific endonuclease VapC